MNGYHIDDYLSNPDNWNFSQQIDYSIIQSEFVELSNVHENIPLVNEINSNTFNLPSSTMAYDFQSTQNSSSKLKKSFQRN
jgi:hypothetical protein